jgi:hypothetical protein
MAHDDPVEYVGSNTAERAEPVRKRGVAPKPVATTTSDVVVDPMPSVAVYTPPAAGESHPKTSRLGPALRLDKAAADLTACNLELTSAGGALRNAELIEADALSALVKAMPGPTPDELLRQHAACPMSSPATSIRFGSMPSLASSRRRSSTP